MDVVTKAEWVAALRSGEYKQTRETLKNENGYCCLGVLAKLVGSTDDIPVDEHQDYMLVSGMEKELPIELLNYLDLTSYEADKLVALNDGNPDKRIEPHTFEQIADWIEKNL